MSIGMQFILFCTLLVSMAQPGKAIATRRLRRLSASATEQAHHPTHRRVEESKIAHIHGIQQGSFLYKLVVGDDELGIFDRRSLSQSEATSATSGETFDRELTTVVQGQVTKLQLLDANTEKPLVDLEDGMVIALDAIPNMNANTVALNVVALVNGTDVRSVRFGLNANRFHRTESTAPYTLCGSSGTNFYSCQKSLGVGTHTITATPRNRNGQTGRPVTMKITIVASDVTSPKLLNLVALSPTTVDVTNAEAEIRFQVTVRDDSSGFKAGLVGFGAADFLSSFFFYFGDLQPSSYPVPSLNVTNNDPVTLNVALRIRRYMKNTTLPLFVNLADDMDNIGLNDANALKNLKFVSTINIINSGPVDTVKPELLSFKALSPLTVAPNSIVSFEVVVKDNLSGIDFGYVDALLADPTTDTSSNTEFGKPGSGPLAGTGFLNHRPELPGGGVSHTFVVQVAIEATQPRGSYDLTVAIGDAVKNWAEFNSTLLSARGFPSKITVV